MSEITFLQLRIPLTLISEQQRNVKIHITSILEWPQYLNCWTFLLLKEVYKASCQILPPGQIALLWSAQTLLLPFQLK